MVVIMKSTFNKASALSLILLLFALAAYSRIICCTGDITDSRELNTSNLSGPNSTYSPATIVNYTGLDGCGWLIMLDDESILEPNGLDTMFQTLGAKIWLKYEDREGGSKCMVGKLITVLDIKERMVED